MRKQREIEFGPYRYEFQYGPNGVEHLPEWLADKPFDRYVILADHGVPDWIVSKCAQVLEPLGPTQMLRFDGGESGKNLGTVQQLAEHIIQSGADRRTAILAVGGGLTGNVAGMVAGLLFRGLPLIHVPTTLMAASDSVLSLKQAVNLQQGKNLVGFFYKPELVCVDYSFLATISRRDVQSGLCELVKNLVAIVPERIDEFRQIMRPTHDYTQDEMDRIIELCIDAKSVVMREDAFEKQQALVLEYGHTIGHALELASQGEYLHGECIAFGMRCVAKIAQRIGLLTEADVRVHDELLDLIDVHLSPSKDMLERIEQYLLKDNKRGYQQQQPGKVGLILLKGIGDPNFEPGRYLTFVDYALVLDVIREQAAVSIVGKE